MPRTLPRKNNAPKSQAIQTSPLPQKFEVAAFVCCCCGNGFKSQSGNFYKAQSALYKGNNGYFPICKDCMERSYLMTLGAKKDDRVALKTLARQWNIYVNDAILFKAMATGAEKSKVAELIKATNGQYNGKTYEDTVVEEESNVAAARGYDTEFDVTDEMRYRWGNSFTPEEYEQLEAHYRSFSEQRTPDDIVQDKLLIDLSKSKIAQDRCFNNGDMDGYMKLSKLYQDTLKSANFKPIQKADLNDANQCWGVLISSVEHFTPAELYKKKSLFDDVDGIREYFQRHIVRPFINFFTGSNEQDSEFRIDLGDDDG